MSDPTRAADGASATVKRRPLVTVLTPVFNEEANVRRCYEEVKRVMATLADVCDYEHLFGDNRSLDGTLGILRELAAADRRVRVLAYSRNFGAEKSSLALLRHARGDATVSVVCDLQDPPAVLPKMIEQWSSGHQVVYGVYRSPDEALLMRALRGLYYWLVDKLSPDPLPRHFTGFALLDRRVVDEVIRVDDHAPYIRGLIATVGFKQIAMPYARAERIGGESKHGFGFLFDFGINGIISHSIVPIRVATYIGAFLSGGSFLTALAYALLKIFKWEVQAPGATSVIVLVLFFSGVQLMFLGLLGEYIGAIHAQVRRKPFLIIEERINFPERRRAPRPVPEPALQADELEADPFEP
ncbi:MAG: glycosyltransferase family 2 protein [Polyangiales bacterium]